ncbi:peptidase family M3 protein [Toxoplasma gondii VEG]|uniref:Peptidase family M3 domain containing protein n=2 Tax=Toxoplasma gondii TaxID=5811 RepID=B9Q3Z6_TOXGV|nr:peptidase family M3 protein [Toxoplasma gondii VEG]CEL75156.1 TPA: peptidase family M3 domain containing protein [Toxoplasma gondii VEG]
MHARSGLLLRGVQAAGGRVHHQRSDSLPSVLVMRSRRSLPPRNSLSASVSSPPVFFLPRSLCRNNSSGTRSSHSSSLTFHRVPPASSTLERRTLRRPFASLSRLSHSGQSEWRRQPHGLCSSPPCFSSTFPTPSPPRKPGLFSFLSGLTQISSRGSRAAGSDELRPGLLQLPGVHTPEQLVRLGRQAVADCEAFLATGGAPTSSSSGSREEGKLSSPSSCPSSASSGEASDVSSSWKEARRAVQALDAVSNTLCKVADGSELLRQVHPDPRWKQAGAEVVAHVQDFMSRVNVNNKVYDKLHRLTEALGDSLSREAQAPSCLSLPSPSTSASSSPSTSYPSSSPPSSLSSSLSASPSSASSEDEGNMAEGDEGVGVSSAQTENAEKHRLTTEEILVLRSMRDAMEQQGVFLEPQVKDRYLRLLTEEATLAAGIAERQETPQSTEGFLVSTDVLLASGVPASLLAQLQGEKRSFFSPRRRPFCRRGGDQVLVAAHSELAHVILRQSADSGLRREVYELQRLPGKDDKETEKQLLRLLHLRQELAKLRGYPTWTAYAQRDGILKTPDKINAFLSRLLDALRPGVESDLKTLSVFGASSGLLRDAKGLDPWDLPFLLRAYSVRTPDGSTGARSISIRDLLEGMQSVVERLLGLRFVRAPTAKGETWHWSVLRYELHEAPSSRASRLFSFSPSSSASPPSSSLDASSSSLRGVLYLDLWARPSKTRLLAQFTVRGSKRLSYAHGQGWRLGGPLWLSAVQRLSREGAASEDEASATATVAVEEELRQIPCAALVCSLPPPPEVDMTQPTGPDVDRLLEATSLSASLTRSLLHECGHVLHSLLSETELQHLSGTRGAVDFAEFPSNLFEHFSAPLLDGYLASPTGRARPALGSDGRGKACNFAHLGALQLLLHACVDQAFYSFVPGVSELPPCSGDALAPSPPPEAVDAQLAALRGCLDTAFSRHHWLAGDPRPGVTEQPICDVVGRPQMARFEHLVHYGGSYFCYLLCRVMSSFAWQHAFAKDPFDRETGKRLHAILRRGSIDCSLRPILELAGPGVLSETQKEQLLNNPHLLPVEPFLEELHADDASAAAELPFP